MLGKLIKHEFRATGRSMLPVYGAVVVLAALANISIRMLDNNAGTLLRILFVLILMAFFICIIAALVMTTVMMIRRFYTNYLKNEGYLMHTLPVSVHSLVWSKMIVSVVWFAATFLIIWIVIILTVLLQSGTNLEQLFTGFPSWAQIEAALEEYGVRKSSLVLLGLEMLVTMILGGLFTCLHFYAAMSLGHMFSKNKILLSVVFYVAISFVLSMANTGLGIGRYDHFEVSVTGIETVQQGIRFAQAMLAGALLTEGVQSALLYAATVLGLKKGLNLD